ICGDPAGRRAHRDRHQGWHASLLPTPQPLAPVAGATSAMGDRDDMDFLFQHLIDDRVWKPCRAMPARSGRIRRPCPRVFADLPDELAHLTRKRLAQPFPLYLVVEGGVE